MSERTFYIIGNWKMNGDKKFIDQYSEEFKSKELLEILNRRKQLRIIIACPFVYLSYFSEKLPDIINVSAQNCHKELKGAFTGEISPSMISDLGCEFVIIGHSERRTLFSENNVLIAEKVNQALSQNLNVILCIGETKSERDSNITEEVIENQLKLMKDTMKSHYNNIIIAYEPVWAIGTGENATAAQVQQVHQYIRNWIAEHVSEDVANKISIIYGGSVNLSNSKDIGICSDVDGFLIGGVSLKVGEFKKIIYEKCSYCKLTRT